MLEMLEKYIWLTLRKFFKIGLEKEEEREEENLLIVRIAQKSRDQKYNVGKIIQWRFKIPYPREYNPILNTTPGDIFWAHFGHFRRKIGQKYGNFRRFFAEIDHSAWPENPKN